MWIQRHVLKRAVVSIRKPSNAGLQLRRAISIHAERKEITWETRYRAVSCKALLDFVFREIHNVDSYFRPLSQTDNLASEICQEADAVKH
jgi:hypothetical protein